MIATLVFLASHLGSILFIVVTAWIFGRQIVRLLPWRSVSPTPPLTIALGLGSISQLLFFVGLVGGFHRPVILLVLLAAHAACWSTWREAGSWLRRLGLRGRVEAWKLASAAALLIPLVTLSLYPPKGWDATTYHLPFVEAFLDAGRLVFVPDLRFPVFPQVAEMGFLLGRVLSGDVVAKLTQMLAVLLTAVILFDWGRRLVGLRAGLWSAALWLGTPLAVWIGSLAYVDAQLSLFVTAALASWESWREDGERSWLWLAGAFAGLAAGTKYLGLFFCGVLLVWTALRSARRARWGAVVGLALTMALFLAPWYLRIAYHTGNPVFPFYAQIFGESAWTSGHDPLLFDAGGGLFEALGRLIAGASENLAFLIATPWNGVFRRELFHFTAPLSPWLLVLIPLGAPFALALPARRPLGIAALYSLFWLTIYHDLRFLLPALPALALGLCAGTGHALERLARRVGGRTRSWLLGAVATWGLAVALVAPGPLYAVYKIWEAGPVPVTAPARKAHLSSQVPGYDAIEALDAVAGEGRTAYGLGTERLRYYAETRLLGAIWGPASNAEAQGLLDEPGELHAWLRFRGACFLLVDRSAFPVEALEGSGEGFETAWSDDRFIVFELCDDQPAGQLP